MSSRTGDGILSVQELAMNSGILKALRILHWDETTYAPKRGSAVMTPNKPGTLRRIVMLRNQIRGDICPLRDERWTNRQPAACTRVPTVVLMLPSKWD